MPSVITLSVVMLSVVILSVFILSVVMLSVVMLRVVMQSVVILNPTLLRDAFYLLLNCHNSECSILFLAKSNRHYAQCHYAEGRGAIVGT
jgi:hypothetical protein